VGTGSGGYRSGAEGEHEGGKASLRVYDPPTRIHGLRGRGNEAVEGGANTVRVHHRSAEGRKGGPQCHLNKVVKGKFSLHTEAGGGTVKGTMKAAVVREKKGGWA